jgi:hypothetical protein
MRVAERNGMSGTGAESATIECLRCGALRSVAREPGSCWSAGECPRCGDPSWSRSADLTDRDRRLLRTGPSGLPAAP